MQPNWIFGEDLHAVADVNTHRFTGHERDAETGLDYMLARYYGSTLRRFMSPDPIFGRLPIPQSLNRYLYTINNPIKYVDPYGLDFYLVDQEGNKVKGGDACKQDGRCDDDGYLIVTSEELEDDESGFSGTVDENGVQITGEEGAAVEGTFTAQFIPDTAPVSLQGSGAFEGFTFSVTGDGGGKALASGTFTAPAGSTLAGLRGAFQSVDSFTGVDKFLHPETRNSYRFGQGPFAQLGETRNLTCGEECSGRYATRATGWFDVDKDHAHSIAHVRCALFGTGCQY